MKTSNEMFDYLTSKFSDSLKNSDRRSKHGKESEAYMNVICDLKRFMSENEVEFKASVIQTEEGENVLRALINDLGEVVEQMKEDGAHLAARVLQKQTEIMVLKYTK